MVRGTPFLRLFLPMAIVKRGVVETLLISSDTPPKKVPMMLFR
jgi:hypothetical protein